MVVVDLCKIDAPDVDAIGIFVLVMVIDFAMTVVVEGAWRF